MAEIRVTGAQRAPQQASRQANVFDPSQHPAYARPAPVSVRAAAPQPPQQPPVEPAYRADPARYGAQLHAAMAQPQVQTQAQAQPATQAQMQQGARPQMQANTHAQSHAHSHAQPQMQAQRAPAAPRVTAGYFAPQADPTQAQQQAPHPHYAAHMAAQPHHHAHPSDEPQAQPSLGAVLRATARMPSAAGAQRAANMAGAAVSLALVVGLGVWGFKLLARDVSGVPVIRAAAGPMRVAPENPGGQPADYQGFAVNQVAAEGAAAKPADRLVLAPKPVDLTVEDTPAVAGALGGSAPVPAAKPRPEGTAVEVEVSGQGAVLPQGKLADIQALAAQLAAGSTPMEETAPTKVSAPVTASLSPVARPAQVAAAAPQVAPKAPASGLAQSLRPRLRPAGLKKTSMSGAVEAALQSASRAGEIDAASLPVGTRLAQLGTFDTADGARTGWHKLDAKFGELLEGKSLVVQQAQSGGRTFYRMRAHGFDDISQARHFCAAFVSEGVECFPVATR